MMFNFTYNEINDCISFIEEHKSLYESQIDLDAINFLIKYIRENNGLGKLTDTEKARKDDFYQRHKNCCYNKTGKTMMSGIGGGFSNMILITPKGIVKKYLCGSCGESEDITDKDESVSDEYTSEEIEKSYNTPLFTFLITGTGLGNCNKIICNKNDDSLDFTDFECW